MVRRFERGFRRAQDRAVTAVGALVVSGLLASCSSVPDAVNPVEWYKGASNWVTGDSGDSPPPVQSADSSDTKRGTADTARGLADGLPADTQNSKYSTPVPREVTPTKPLVRRTPAPQSTQVAQAPAPAAAPRPAVETVAPAPQPEPAASAAVPPKPQVTAQELPPAQPQQTAQAQSSAPRIVPGQRQPVARDEGPANPPAAVDMAPPPSAGIPETVATTTQQRGPRRLQEQYERRLAESSQQSVTVNPVAMPQGNGPAYGLRDETPIHLIPPTSGSKRGGGKGLAAPQPAEAAASFQVATLDFHADSARLTDADMRSLADVARLYKQTPGIVRIVGYAPSRLPGANVDQMMDDLDASMKRANAVAQALTKRGVPASKIMVGAAPSNAAGQGAQIYLDVM